MSRVFRELYISYKFVRRDFSTSIYPPAIFLITSLKHQADLPWPRLGLIALYGLIYAWLYIYLFCLSNQIAGVEEDRANKPDRPIVSGLVTVRGAMWRWVAVMCAFPIVGWHLGVLKWALLWQLLATLHNFFGWSRHWVTKGTVMSLGTLAQLAAAWQIGGPLTPLAWKWILWVSMLVFPTVPLQDLRDMAGDRLSRRKTLPLALGENNARFALFGVYLVLPLAVHFGMMTDLGPWYQVALCEFVLTVISWLVAVRILHYRTAQHDHRTYMLYTYWYCLILASALVLV